jgi:hypothetical protein
MVGWDASGSGLDIIVRREASSSSHDGWGHYAGDGDGWGVPDEQEVSVEVLSLVKDSKGSSACRCRFLPSIDLN